MKKKWCVFTSAGDYHNIAAWTQQANTRSWDLIVAFYGEDERVFSGLVDTADAVVRMKGCKFQNLKKLMTHQKGLFKGYDYIWVADDDIIITPENIEALFRITTEYGFWAAHPAFSWEGRVSHPITARQEGGADIRIVNFIEMTAPLFERSKLEDFMDVYDGELVGWGVDWWFCNHLEANRNRRFAVIDSVPVINPHEHQRPGGAREITKLEGDERRAARWKETARRLHLKEYPMRVFSRIFEVA